MENERTLFNQEQSQLNDLKAKVKEIEEHLATEKTNLAKLLAQHSQILNSKETVKYGNNKLNNLIRVDAEIIQEHLTLTEPKV